MSCVDIPATMAELAGVEIQKGFDDSHSFADELGAWAGAPERSFVFTERYSATYDDEAVIEKTWKLRRVDPDGTGPLPAVDSFYVHPDKPLHR